MGELVVIRNGQLIRHFLHQESDEWNDEQRLDIGTLGFETDKPLKSWGDVWVYVEDDRWLGEA